MTDADQHDEQKPRPIQLLTVEEYNLVPSQWRTLLKVLAEGTRELGVYNANKRTYTVEIHEDLVVQWERLSSQS